MNVDELIACLLDCPPDAQVLVDDEGASGACRPPLVRALPGPGTEGCVLIGASRPDEG